MKNDLLLTKFRADIGGNGFGQREERTHNSSYTQGGVSCLADSFVVAESSVLRTNFSAKKPALRVAAKR